MIRQSAPSLEDLDFEPNVACDGFSERWESCPAPAAHYWRICCVPDAYCETCHKATLWEITHHKRGLCSVCLHIGYAEDTFKYLGPIQ